MITTKKAGLFRSLRIALAIGHEPFIEIHGPQFLDAVEVWRHGADAVDARGERVYCAGISGRTLVALGRTPKNSAGAPCHRWLTADELRRRDPSRLPPRQRALYFDAIDEIDPDGPFRGVLEADEARCGQMPPEPCIISRGCLSPPDDEEGRVARDWAQYCARHDFEASSLRRILAELYHLTGTRPVLDGRRIVVGDVRLPLPRQHHNHMVYRGLRGIFRGDSNTSERIDALFERAAR
jgi:hypothetical protein